METTYKKKELRNYWAYKTIKNFACLVVNQEKLDVYVTIDYQNIEKPQSNVKDVKGKGHWGTDNTVVFISNEEELEYTKDLIKKIYNGEITN